MSEVFEGKMTEDEYIQIFNRAKSEWSLLSLDEKIERRRRLERAILAGKVERHALEISIDEDIEKADEETKKKYKKVIPAISDELKEATKRRTAQEKAVEKAAEALGMSVIEFKKINQKRQLEKLMKDQGIEKTVCERHKIEFEMTSCGVGCRKCDFERNQGFCVIHSIALNQGLCSKCATESIPQLR